MRSRHLWLRRFIWILAVDIALRQLQSLILYLYRRYSSANRRPEPRPPQRTDCQSIPSSIYRRPDPLIYDQFYLASQGLAVTWDNPDVTIELDGVPVDAHNLKPATTYDIIARVWNSSTDAPALYLPVYFSFLSFGIGTTKTLIPGATYVSVGVKGSPSCPAYAHHSWTTPATPGHYCLQVELDPPDPTTGLRSIDDANLANNLGQSNTDVRPLNSPQARFSFPIHNPYREPQTITLRADDYAISTPKPCRDAPATTPEQSEQERAQRRRRALAAHGKDRFSSPAGWEISIEPAQLHLEPGKTREVSVIATTPAGFTGRQPINVNAFVGETLLGGVTLYAEGKA